jgi:AraC-like DNA-binding protein
MEEEDCKIINYSNVFLSCFTDNASMYTPMIKDHGLVYMLAGELEINERGTITCLHRGECAFIRKDNRVSITKLPKEEEQFKSVWLSFSRKFLREFYQTLDKKRLPKDVERPSVSVYKLPASRPDIASLFESITPYFDSGIPPTEELLNLKMTEGMYVLLNTDKSFYSSLFDFTEPWKIDILDYMNENYMYDLSIEDIASYTGRSLAVFKRDFKKISPLSPEKWRMEKRLEVAYNKIRSEGKKVSDVYLEVGFKNLSHFSVAFKRQYGFPPTAM